MDHNILCPHCKKTIPLNDALSHEIREKYRKDAIEWKTKKEAEFKSQLELERKKFEEEKKLSEKDLEERTRKKLESEISLKLKDSQNEREELKKNNEEQQKQLLELTRALRQLKTENDQKQLELEKKLAEEQEKIRETEKKRVDEEYRLKMLEQDKKLADALKVNDELKRKLEQGSQQTQGEVLELEIENTLKSEFPYDEIRPVAKGVRGGDLLQVVRNNQGKVCGSIIWEMKRTKSWSNDWVLKLREDQRTAKAELAALITVVLPSDIKNFGRRENVWIANFECFLGMAHALRHQLLEVALMKSSEEGKAEKMEVLYNYISGIEFRQRVEAIVEAFQGIQKDIEDEKRWFAKKWAKQERNVRKVMDNMFGMSGDLQSITGEELKQLGGDLTKLPSDTFSDVKMSDELFAELEDTTDTELLH